MPGHLPGTECNRHYFIHAKKLIPDFQQIFQQYSGISHHMLLQRCILEDLFALITKNHEIEPWKAMVCCINPYVRSSMSEYEIYFNFVFSRTDQVKIRLLKWANADEIYLNKLTEYKLQNYDYISCHAYCS